MRATLVRFLNRRDDIESITGAARLVDERMPQMLTASDALLDQSGATAAVQEFQRRGAAVRVALSGLAASAAGGNSRTAQAIAENMTYLRSVTEALSGGDSALDIAALDDAAREVALVPVISELVDIEAQVAAAITAAANLGDLGASVTGINNVAATLLGGAFSSSGVSVQAACLPTLSCHLALLVLALLLVGGLVLLHSKAAVFEQTSREQSEQNERNQQAILRSA